MKKKTKINTNKTSNRGRPPKAFVSKKTQIKRDKPGRPKKHEKIDLPQIPEKKENKIKDAIIRILFIISFFVFAFSIYVSQKQTIHGLFANENTKESQANPMIEEILPNPAIEEIQQPETFPESVEPIAPQDPKYFILKQIYGSLKTLNIDEIYIYIDNSLKQSTIFKTYFSKNRLQRFINNIDNQNINIELINIDNETSKVGYKLVYSIKNISFIEEREATFITKNSEIKIAKIMCITKGCSTMPFFNPGKYF